MIFLWLIKLAKYIYLSSKQKIICFQLNAYMYLFFFFFVIVDVMVNKIVQRTTTNMIVQIVNTVNTPAIIINV